MPKILCLRLDVACPHSVSCNAFTSLVDYTLVVLFRNLYIRANIHPTRSNGIFCFFNLKSFKTFVSTENLT